MELFAQFLAFFAFLPPFIFELNHFFVSFLQFQGLLWLPLLLSLFLLSLQFVLKMTFGSYFVGQFPNFALFYLLESKCIFTCLLNFSYKFALFLRQVAHSAQHLLFNLFCLVVLFMEKTALAMRFLCLLSRMIFFRVISLTQGWRMPHLIVG